MKELIAEKISAETKIQKNKLSELIEVPPSLNFGDYALPCFTLSKTLKKSPNEIAVELKEKLDNKINLVKKIEVKGGYLNFFLDRKAFSSYVIDRVKDKNFGTLSIGNNKTVMIEFTSPNTNKPLHLGHLRNMAIGESVSRIAEACGYKVIRANLNNDRGIHICESMIGYKLFGKGKTPSSEKKKSDHFVGEYYIKFHQNAKENPSLVKEAKKCLIKWEKGERETRELWKRMNKWVYDGWKKTYKNFGIKHDVEFFESKIYKRGKKIIEDGLKKGIFKKKKDNAVYIDLKKENLGEKILLRSDGTSVYITQDLYLVELKNKKFNLDKNIYVVANEQDYHFKVLKEILKKINYKYYENFFHLSYGMVNLGGEKIKSREGLRATADELIEKAKVMSEQRIKEQNKKISKKELEKRSLIISNASIKYVLLKTDIKKDITFDVEKALNFEGDTGPYLMYSYARASSILKKAKIKNRKYDEVPTDTEYALLKKIDEFEQHLKDSLKNYSPTIIANYAHNLCRIFNEFYHGSKVIGHEKEGFRLEIVNSFRKVLGKSLWLLGIEALEEM